MITNILREIDSRIELPYWVAMPKHYKRGMVCDMIEKRQLRQINYYDDNIRSLMIDQFCKTLNPRDPDMLVARCSACHRFYLKGNLRKIYLNHSNTTKASLICNDCLSAIIAEYAKCTDCGDYVHWRRITYISEGHVVCPTCRVLYKRCSSCGKFEALHSMRRTIDGASICSECASSRYKSCAHCGVYVLTGHEISYGAKVLCLPCFSAHYTDIGGVIYSDTHEHSHSHLDAGLSIPSGDTTDPLRFVGFEETAMDSFGRPVPAQIDRIDECESYSPNIHAYSYEPSYEFKRTFKQKHSIKHLYMGIELEVGGAKSVKSVNKFIEPFVNNDDIYFKKDSSIPQYGVEIVSMPCTLDYHKKDLNWKSICTHAVDCGLKSHDIKDCGLHININRDFMNPSAWVKFWFFINNKKERSFISRIARRRSRFAVIEHKLLNATLLYDVTGECASRHVAVNGDNEYRIELRIFKGTLKYESLIACMEFADALVRYCRLVSFNDLKHDMVKNFLLWLIKNNRSLGYSHLLQYISERTSNLRPMPKKDNRQLEVKFEVA